MTPAYLNKLLSGLQFYFMYTMTMYAVAILILFIVSYLLLNKKRKSVKKCVFDVFPEPPRTPLVGHTFNILSTKKILSRTTEFFKYGETVILTFGPSICPIRQVLMTQDSKFTELVLTSKRILSKSENYQFLNSWLGKGLLISDGDHWKSQRKILTSTFHFEILKQFVGIFERVGGVLVEQLGQYEGAESVDLHPLITLCTLDIICETAMGTKIDVQSGENSQYVQSVKEMCRITTERAVQPWKQFDFSYWLFKDFYTERRIVKDLHSFTKGVINSKKGSLDENTKKMAFLDLLLKFSQKGSVLSDEEMREETDTFMFAGHDTTAAAISFALYSLAENLEAQEKVFQEQQNLFGDEKNPDLTYTDLQNMKYLECVIKETLRLYPPVPAIGRCTSEEIEYEDYVIPKYTNIIMFVYGLHRNPTIFPEPERFIPERFENFGTTLPYVYIPFSAGPRNCIGQKFAMLEMKSVISKIVRHFEIGATSPRHELVLSVETVIKSVNGIKVTLTKRQ